MTFEGYSIARLSEEDKDNLANFDCCKKVASTSRRKSKNIEGHSLDMNNFLVNEALMEQNEGYNTTFLVHNNNNNKEILAYISLCTDAIKLNYSERDNGQIGYETFPSLKIARLAVHHEYQQRGLGKLLINFAIYKALEMRNQFCGVKFITLDCFPHRLSYYENIGFVKNLEHLNNHNGIISLRLHIDDYLEKYDS